MKLANVDDTNAQVQRGFVSAETQNVLASLS